ncbi:uncharacterized protein LOC108595933 [Drosophila busckii]|uniref:uncharacterized protein LOC108595933 n=1 Tax=Drosophila busckii TaxID=30019 RepID=UPI00083EBD99|nr:uncharacterized protein LOC108595933 [Drosophila busckii]
MMSKLIACVFVLLLPIDNAICKRMWEYTLISVNTTSADPSKFKMDAEIVRISRTEFGLSVNVVLNFVIDETTFAVVYRSNTGNEEDYVLMPWSVAKQTYEEFTKAYYKNFVYKNLAHCSNLPTPDKAYPLPLGTVMKFERCIIPGESLPDYVPDGYYKTVFTATGEVELSAVLTLKVSKITDLFG